MKTGLIVYHKNLKTIYPPLWIHEFKQSILNQTYKLFDIYEICYSGEDDRIFENSIYENKELPTFIHAMNYLMDKCLNDGADAVANANVDDYFSFNRLGLQLPYIDEGVDIVASNFCLIRDGNEIYHQYVFDKLDIKSELNKGHNIISHPSVVYSRKFLKENRYMPEEFPVEDMLLWKRTIDHYKFKIVKENLLFHRIHNNSVCQSQNR